MSKLHPGDRIGYLRVVELDHRSKSRDWYKVICDCGNVKVIRGDSLLSESTTSCGCKSGFQKTHGMTKTKLYDTWSHMKRRCLCEADAAYRNYGERGIAIDPEFLNFENFQQYILSNLGPCPNGMSLDRIDNSRGYEPGNVRWATDQEQNLNRRNTIKLSYEGKERNLKEIAILAGVSYKSLSIRVRLRRSRDQPFDIDEIILKMRKE